MKIKDLIEILQRQEDQNAEVSIAESQEDWEEVLIIFNEEDVDKPIEIRIMG
jgi:hypothetical protein